MLFTKPRKHLRARGLFGGGTFSRPEKEAAKESPAMQAIKEPVAQKKFSNGKHYPMWGSIVDAQAKFIGGKLTDLDAGASTEITGLSLEEMSGSVIFWMLGKDFDCSVNVEYGGVRGHSPAGFRVAVYQMEFIIEPPKEEKAKKVWLR